MYSLSIVIPAFNEELRLEATLNKIDAFLKAEDWNAELIVVDDGSIDRTAQLVMRHMPEKPYLRLLQNHINRGKGFSIRRGVEAALGEVILLTDADLSVPLKEAHQSRRRDRDWLTRCAGRRVCVRSVASALVQCRF